MVINNTITAKQGDIVAYLAKQKCSAFIQFKIKIKIQTSKINNLTV